MYVVAGVTGNTGSVVAETLLAKGQKVRVLVRDEKKGAAWKARGAEIAVASLETGEGLAEALRGATGVYALVPPNLASEDPFGRARAIVGQWERALASSGAKQVVFLSSQGAQHEKGTGIIRTLHEAEARLRAGKIPTTFLRAAYFVENWLGSAGAVKAQGVLPSFQTLDKKFAQVATRDIGLTAANALLEPTNSHRVIELAGPVELSARDVAAAFAKVLGKDVTPILVPEAQIAPTLQSFGISAATAELFRELAVGVNTGVIDWEGKGATFVRGSTTAEAVLRAALE